MNKVEGHTVTTARTTMLPFQDRLQAGVVHDRFAVSDFRKLFGGGAAATANARFTASAISSPIPSPAINVAVCTIP